MKCALFEKRGGPPKTIKFVLKLMRTDRHLFWKPAIGNGRIMLNLRPKNNLVKKRTRDERLFPMRFFRSNTNFAHHVSFLSWVGGVSSHILPAVFFSFVTSLTPVPEKKKKPRMSVSKFLGYGGISFPQT